MVIRSPECCPEKLHKEPRSTGDDVVEMLLSQEETSIKTQKSAVRFTKRVIITLSLAGLLGGAMYLLICGKKAQNPDHTTTKSVSQIIPVTAMAAKKTEMGVYITCLGNVTPLSTVVVRPRVDGQLMEVHFKEGQTVNRGDLLAVIDPRPFQVQLAQAEGQMMRDRELLKNAHIDLSRYRLLWEQNSISKQQLDTQEALVRQYEGVVKSDQAQMDSARLQLLYSRVTAPISGRIGLRQVDAGNIVHANEASVLGVITQTQPITVVFSVPEHSLSLVVDRFRSGTSLTVELFDRERKQKLATGTLVSIDNQIDPATGTVKFKAVFPNRDNTLFPNQFVNVRLLLETHHNSIVVPATAVQRGSKGNYVFLIKADGTTAIRQVTIGVTQGEEIAVTSGLEAGEVVVVDGTEHLREGSKVKIWKPEQGGKVRRAESEFQPVLKQSVR